jgi:hypothetical protein
VKALRAGSMELRSNEQRLPPPWISSAAGSPDRRVQKVIHVSRRMPAPPEAAPPLLLCDFGNPSSYPGAGTTLTNLGTASCAGTLTGGPTWSPSGGGTLPLDGVNDYVQFNDTGGSLIPTAGLTLIVWARTSINNKYLVDKKNGSFANPGYSLEFNSVGAISFGVMSALATSSTGQANGAWMMLSGAWVPSTSLTLRRNNTTLATTTTSVPSAISAQTTALRWGARANNSDYWNGSIARLVIFGRSLNASELAAEYAANRARFGLPA